MTDTPASTADIGPASAAPHIAFDNTYARLPDRLFARLDPTPVAAPRLLKLNVGLARDLGLDAEALATPAGVAILAGNAVANGSQPIAQAYAGHQFGNLSPQLGDGRAILLGEVINPAGQRFDIQLKGSGPTPFSRRGDGRAALGPVLREYIIAEAMAALGVPTTRALAAVATGERVFRETILPGAVLTRVAASHIRVGTFQYFAVRGDTEAVKTLADYVIDRHYPEAASAPNRYRSLLDSVIQRQAELIAHWMSIGFIHGVMNTDNCAISGETIDYGPCAFIDGYHPGTVYSSIDEHGRYAYANQPQIALWNLARFAETLLPLLADTEADAVAAGEAALDAFADIYRTAHLTRFRAKIGLTEPREGDAALIAGLMDVMAANTADFTLTFSRMTAAVADATVGRDAALAGLFKAPSAWADWATRWKARLAEETCAPAHRAEVMRRANPLFIPRNHRVEQALAAALKGDFDPFERLVAVLSRPFDDQPENAAYLDPPEPDEVVRATFCGT